MPKPKIKRTVYYCIYKRTVGVPFPGEEWDGPHTSARAAKRIFRAHYDDPAFHLVRVTETTTVEVV